ncbi:MAG: zinc-ribbon domain-containing protein [Deltaproteobacteria bacterium]|nr:MAG: zinc-ribbon domain-containing protein [Deltaproteobacteria bacterium]
MVVICEKCQTRFRLADDKISAKGVKVRCSKCQHTFVVKKASAEPGGTSTPPSGGESVTSTPPGPELPETPSMDDQALDTAISAALSGIMEGKGQDKTPVPEEFTTGESPSSGPPPPGEGGFSFSQDQFDFSEETGSSAEGVGTETDTEEPSLGEGFDFKEGKAEESEPEFKGIEFDSTDEPPPEVDMPPAREEPAFPPAPVDEVPPKKKAPAPPKFIAPPKKVKRRGEGSPASRIILILLFSGALLYGGFFTWQHRGELLGIGGSGPSGVGEVSGGNIEISITRKYFIPRTIRGQSLFVIEGKATNNYSSSRSFIRVKGFVYNYKGEQMMTEEVYAGNVIPEKDLRNLSHNQIKDILNNKFGELGSNMDVRPDSSVDFVIVFVDLPGEVAECEVKVSDSQAGSQ